MSLDPEQIITYLHDNPDFFHKNPTLLEKLKPPIAKKGNNIADFQYFLLEKLRLKNTNLQSRQEQLLETAHANLTNQSRIYAAVLVLLEAADFEEFAQAIVLDVPILLDVNVCRLVLETDCSHPEVCIVDKGQINAWLGEKNSLLQSNVTAVAEIFDNDAENIKSQALLRLDIGTTKGLLAFGSYIPESFDKEQGTDQIQFLACVIERILRKWFQ